MRYEEVSLKYKQYLHTNLMEIKWLKQCWVEIASQKKLPAKSEQYVGKNLCTKLTPFTFFYNHWWQYHWDWKCSDGLCQGSMAEDWSHVVDERQQHHRVTNKHHINTTLNIALKNRVHRLTWHEGRIASDELWTKFEGDRGEGIFKKSLQIVNVKIPNAFNTTCVFCMF